MLNNCVFSIDLYVQQKYKELFRVINFGPVTGKTGFPLVDSLSLSPSPSLSFSGWISIWGMEAHHVYFLALASKTHVTGRPRQGTLRYSSVHWWLT